MIPADGCVQVWLATFPSDAGELSRLAGRLSPDERLRAGRLIDPEVRSRFAAGRGFLRETLGRYLGEEPERLVFGTGEFGKPFLAGGVKRGDLRFNISHAGNRLLLAVTTGKEVGVDLEFVRSDLDYPEMAKHYLSVRERSELLALPRNERLAAFYRLWTRKEAYLKGSGTGFSLPCTDFDVSLIPGHPPELLCHRVSPEETSRWTLTDIPVPEGYCAALAFEGEKPDLTIFPAGKP